MLCFIVIGAFIDSFTQCFIAGTLVLTSLGLKKIEKIKVGDKVQSYKERQDKLKAIVGGAWVHPNIVFTSEVAITTAGALRTRS